jgi:hypothetical protein
MKEWLGQVRPNVSGYSEWPPYEWILTGIEGKSMTSHDHNAFSSPAVL